MKRSRSDASPGTRTISATVTSASAPMMTSERRRFEGENSSGSGSASISGSRYSTLKGASTSLEIERHLAGGPRAADQRHARRRRLERVGPVDDLADDEPGLARVAHAGAARPPHRHVTGLGELEQAREGLVPRDRQVAAAERDRWARP